MDEVTVLPKSDAPPSTSEDELRELMVLYQADDAVAVEELVHRLSTSLLGYFMSPPGSRTDAEDLLQE